MKWHRSEKYLDGTKDSDLYVHIRPHLPVKVLLLDVNHREMLFPQLFFDLCWSFLTFSYIDWSLSCILLLLSAIYDVLTWWPVVPGCLTLPVLLCHCERSHCHSTRQRDSQWPDYGQIIPCKADPTLTLGPKVKKAFDFHHLLSFLLHMFRLVCWLKFTTSCLSLSHCGTLRIKCVFQVSWVWQLV